MPLPTPPRPSNEPSKNTAGEASLPGLDEVSLPPVSPPPAKPRSEGLPLPPSPTKEVPKSREEDRGWRVDPKTGKKYKVLAKNSPDAVKSAKNGEGLTLDQLFKYTEDDPDFNLDDLNGSAETFLAHLRVPPSPEELKKLRAEREARLRRAEAQRVRESTQDEEA